MIKLNNFIRVCIAIVLILTILYLGSQVTFIFRPILSLITIATVPLMLSAFFYYLLRPLVNIMERKKMNRTLSILLIYLVFGLFFVGFILGVWPSLRDQFINLLNNAPDLFVALGKQLQNLEQSGILSQFFPSDTSPSSQITDYLNKGFSVMTNYLSGLFSVISNITVILFIFPIVLFYMLKDSGNFGRKLVSFTPKRFHKEAAKVVADIDRSLSSFIVGRVLINLALGVLMYFGFIIIGLPYALLLTVIAVIMNFVPFVGAILSAIPIVIIGLIESPSIGIWSLVIILVAQQIQDNLIAPYIFGKQLDIHPITTIILVLVGGDLAGIIGVLLIIPVYMIIKIVVVKIYDLFFRKKWEKA
ncbi:AI-2E family transporter [Paenibacillus segetis]|uniref:UPF0118 membrane protein YueF n=1 Tax=Paenibacillus segetis TaxID=1325360 RepID=A0ABQ1Y8P3_9BACL|nr:AI-2E family transporter [Paenibacillus segetis]GGH15184.1 UPF0118 membrane protein YueF [Paenibacillus segetis]